MNSKKPLKGRSCYGHFGGTLGGRLFERLLELEENKATVYKLTLLGEKSLTKLGVDIYEKR
jgi:hypothetical protein